MDWFYKLAERAPITLDKTPEQSAHVRAHPLKAYGGPNNVNKFIAEGLVQKVPLLGGAGGYAGYRLELTDKGREVYESLK